jgi:hypothetical protein
MNWIRTAVAFGLLAGIGVGCSKKDVASRPANAPLPSEEKPFGPPKGAGQGDGPGAKQGRGLPVAPK